MAGKGKLSDDEADAILGTAFLRWLRQSLTGAKDVTAMSDKVFKLPPNYVPPEVTKRLLDQKRPLGYHGSADSMERQARRVAENTETLPGEFD